MNKTKADILLKSNKEKLKADVYKKHEEINLLKNEINKIKNSNDKLSNSELESIENKKSIIKQHKSYIKNIKYDYDKNKVELQKDKINQIDKTDQNAFSKFIWKKYIGLLIFFNTKINFIKHYKIIRNIDKIIQFTSSMAGETISKKIAMSFVRGIWLFIMAIVVLFPFFWMISMSFRTFDEMKNLQDITLFPKKWSWEAYSFLFNNPHKDDLVIPINRYILNSFFICALSTTIQVVVSLFGGYAISNFKTKINSYLMGFLLISMMLPGEAMLVGQFIFAVKIDLYDTFLALIVPFIGNAFTIIMFKNAFDTINDSIKKAAKIDGVSTFKLFWKISIPLIRSTIFTSFLISFITAWNAVLWPQMVLSDDNKWQTLPMLLWEILQNSTASGSIWNIQGITDPINLKMSVSLVTILPMFILFIFTKKYIIRGITRDSGSKE